MDILDSPVKNEHESYFPSLKRYIIITLFQVVVNIILFTYILRNYPEPMFLAVTVSSLLLFPILSIVLGLFTALLPYKDLTYKAKYWPSVLLWYFVMNSIVTTAVLIGLVHLTMSP